MRFPLDGKHLLRFWSLNVWGCWRSYTKDGPLQFSSFAIMKRKAMLCCKTTRDMYEDYYTKHSGRGMPVFAGAR